MKPRVGVSACLLGQEVRWDGGHKREDWITTVLGAEATLVPVCPEVEMGLGVPRPPIGVDAAGRLRVLATGEDLTDRMAAFADARLAGLEGIAGFVLKARSPSCDRSGGMFARALLARFPDLPVEDEVHLRDPAVRASFLRRILEGDAP